MTVTAVGLLSGGLDSTLAAKVVQSQGIDVIGVNFFTGFCISEHSQRVRRRNKKPVRNEALRAGGDLGVPIEIIDISKDYLHVLSHPKHGYGSNMNPCIDCRGFMFQKAREFMDEIGAQFLFTGEVLGQRPMSQHRRAMTIIEQESGCAGLVVRPLSAKRLPPTIPEKEGWLDRDKLLGITGRGRSQQLRLVKELGITDFPTPAGGCCFLTDENYARKLRDFHQFNLLGEMEDLTLEDIVLLKVGRHFRLSPSVKLVVGRDEGENNFLDRSKGARIRLGPLEVMGPVALIEVTRGATLPPDELEIAAGITARYCDGSALAGGAAVRIGYRGESREGELTVAPRAPDDLERWRI